MGKNLIIKNADFSQNKINSKYLYNIPDEYMLLVDREWSSSGFGYTLINQSALKEVQLLGVKLNISIPGELSIFKTTELSNYNSFVQLDIISTSQIGLQDIYFSSIITISAYEYIVFGSHKLGLHTLVPWYKNSEAPENLPRGFYYSVGKEQISTVERICLNVDFIIK